MLKSVRTWSQRFKARGVAALLLGAALSLPGALAQKGQVAEKPRQATLAPPMSAKLDQRPGTAQAVAPATAAAPATAQKASTTTQKTTTVKKTADVKASTEAAKPQVSDGAKPAAAKTANDGKQPADDKKSTAADSSAKSKDAKADAKTDAKTDVSKGAKTAPAKKSTVKKIVTKRRSNSMVPPPPPEMPTIMPTTDPELMSISGLPLEFLTGEALRERQKELKAQLTEVRDGLAMRERNCTDKIQRAEQFESLYQEGVVSRRELETAQMEAKDCEHEMERVKSKIANLDALLKKVDERVAKQPVNKATPKASDKKKRSK